jgi:predicted dehydrogenase
MPEIRIPNQKMGLLVVGTGDFGARRAAAAMLTRGVRLVAVADRDPHLAAAVARRHRVPVVRDLRDGLRLAGVDAVAVATPPADHVDLVHQALDAGRHVLCEKPLAIDPDDARALVHHAEDVGVRLATGFNHRFYPPIREAFRLVSSWAIGRVESLRVQIGHRATPEFLAGWHTNYAVSGGGTLMDNGPHACDLVRRFLGDVVAAQGYLRDPLELAGGCESEAFALFRTYDRRIAELRSSWVLERGYLTLELRGSAGHLCVETAPWRLAGRLADGRRLGRAYLPERASAWVMRRRHGCEPSLVEELEAFAASGANASGWDGCHSTEMIAAVYESARSGEEALPRGAVGVRVEAAGPLERSAA